MALGGAVLAVMGILGVAGPFVLMTIARKRSGTTSDAATLVASRRNTGDPRAAWREVAGIALTSFVLVPAGSLLGFLHAVANGPSVLSMEQIVFITDTRFMLIALVVVSFVVAACQTATTQAASLLENRELYIALDRIGAPRAVMNRARYRQVHAPVLVAVIGSALAASALGFALVVVAITNSPFSSPSLLRFSLSAQESSGWVSWPQPPFFVHCSKARSAGNDVRRNTPAAGRVTCSGRLLFLAHRK